MPVGNAVTAYACIGNINGLELTSIDAEVVFPKDVTRCNVAVPKVPAVPPVNNSPLCFGNFELFKENWLAIKYLSYMLQIFRCYFASILCMPEMSKID